MKKYSLGIMINGQEFLRCDRVDAEDLGIWLTDQLMLSVGPQFNSTIYDIQIKQFAIVDLPD